MKLTYIFQILILDEATASVDSQTDSAIQATLAEVFTDCTILVIAHRLSTIMTCDKVIVLADGEVSSIEGIMLSLFVLLFYYLILIFYIYNTNNINTNNNNNNDDDDNMFIHTS